MASASGRHTLIIRKTLVSTHVGSDLCSELNGASMPHVMMTHALS